jgi:hypothetical protein
MKKLLIAPLSKLEGFCFALPFDFLCVITFVYYLSNKRLCAMSTNTDEKPDLKLDPWLIQRIAKLRKLVKTSALQKQLLIFFDKPELNELEQSAFEKIVRAERSLEQARKKAKLAENALHRNSSKDRADRRKVDSHGKILIGVTVVLMIRNGCINIDSFLSDAQRFLNDADFAAMSAFLELELSKKLELQETELEQTNPDSP